MAVSLYGFKKGAHVRFLNFLQIKQGIMPSELKQVSLKMELTKTEKQLLLFQMSEHRHSCLHRVVDVNGVVMTQKYKPGLTERRTFALRSLDTYANNLTHPRQPKGQSH